MNEGAQHENMLLEETNFSDNDINRETMIRIDGVTMIFNMASQMMNNLKEYFIALAHRELMFKEFKALDDISLEVKKGDVYGILGTNGSGKSTLLKIVAGVLEPTEGSVNVYGNIAPLIELGAGFDHELTARENIYLNGALLGYSRQFIDDHFDAIVDFAEIGEFLDVPLKNYSSGMIARIAFAIATVIVPDILIVDEVLSVGDFMFRQKCERRIQSLIKEHDVTVLIVSHSIDQIKRLCNKAIWIEKSHTRMIGPTKEVCLAYEALAGHKGSSEAEQVILKLLLDPAPKTIDEIESQSITASTRYSINEKALGQCDFIDTDSFVIVSGENATAMAIGLGLAGALECPFVITQGDCVLNNTRHILLNLAPKRAIILNQGEEIFDSTVQRIRELCGGESIEISGSDACDLSQQVLSFVKAEKEALHAPLVLSAAQVVDISSVSDCIYEKGLPILIEENKKTDDTDLSFYEKHDEQLDQGVTQIVMAASSSTADCFISGMLASKMRAKLICTDRKDFDEMLHAISKLSAVSSTLEKIVFVGGDNCFSEGDKALLLKAVAQSREHQREHLAATIEFSK